MTRKQLQHAEAEEHLVLRDEAFLLQVALQSLLPAREGADTSRVGMASTRGEYLPAEVGEGKTISAPRIWGGVHGVQHQQGG